MRTRELQKWIRLVSSLSRKERSALRAEMAALDAIDTGVQVIEAQAPQHCPHCAATHIVRNGHANGLQRYLCHDCRKTFNALTGTTLARLHQRGKWLNQSAALALGQTLRQVARQLNIAVSTAHRWRHRFLHQPGVERIAALQGIAEADETYFLHSRKGQRRLDRPARRRGGKASTRGLAPVLYRSWWPVIASGKRPISCSPRPGRLIWPVPCGRSCPPTRFFAPMAAAPWRQPHVRWASNITPSMLQRVVGCEVPGISRTSMPSIADSNSGCIDSRGSRRAIWPTISAGSVLSTGQPILPRIPLCF